MAYIEPEINDFLSAIHGEEVRNSMVSLARKLNTELEAGTTTINQYTTDITQAISDAATAAGSANSAAGSANSAAGAANDAASAANTARANVEANEAARQSAETARANAEQGRVAAEQGRVTAEQGRAGAETARANAETDRGNAEAQRVAAEQGRAAAEATRVSAEAERVGRESARVANEDLRQAQERDRVNAETERQRAFNNMSQQVLPPATTTTLGGVIVGDGLSVDTDGKIGVTGGGDIETRTHAEATYAKITDLDDKANTSHTHEASEITSGTLPIARGGTGLDASPSMLTNLGSTTAANVMQASPRPGVTGTLPVANGGTGVTSNPSMLTNLGSTSADDVLKASPRPGVTGTLPVDHGGTGATTAAEAAENIVDGQNIKPASVAATGEVSGKSGTTTHKLTEKAESKAIAYVESTTATANHATGDYFMLGGVLMRATAAIATGETISASNAVPATVQGQIDTLNDTVSQKSIADCNVGKNQYGWMLTSPSTLNTPYNQGVTQSQQGWLFSTPTSGNYATQFFYPLGNSAIYCRSKISGTWNEWTIASINGDEKTLQTRVIGLQPNSSVKIRPQSSYDQFFVFTQRHGLFTVWNTNGTIDVNAVHAVSGLSFVASGSKDFEIRWSDTANSLSVVCMSYKPFSVE